eukprot:3166120-Rhodomonas_salina.2
MQHWFVLTRYVSVNAYTFIMLVLEAFFEWTVLSNWECLYAPLPTDLPKYLLAFPTSLPTYLPT